MAKFTKREIAVLMDNQDELDEQIILSVARFYGGK